MRISFRPVIMTVAGAARFLLEDDLDGIHLRLGGVGYLFGWTWMPPRIAMLQGFYVDVPAFSCNALLTMLIHYGLSYSSC